MHRSLISLAGLGILALSGCATDTAAGAPDQKAQVSTDTLSVYRSTGARQCTGGGATLEADQGLLAGAGIRVLSSSCGSTGRMYASVCGGATGDIHIFEIPASQKDAAEKLQFSPLSSLPGAKKSPCA